MKNKSYTFQLNNKGLKENFVKFQFNNKGDSYIFPHFPSSSILFKAGAHISFHASGQSHLRLHYPISCFNHGPYLKLLFDRNEFMRDIIAKRTSLFQSINLTQENKAGIVSILNNLPSFLSNYLSNQFKVLFENKQFVDYYNLIKTNPYFPSSHYSDYFPFNNFEVDIQMIYNSISQKITNNIYEYLYNLKDKGIIKDTDIICFTSFDDPYSLVIMLGNFIGIRLDYNNPLSILNQIPGGKAFKNVYESLQWRG